MLPRCRVERSLLWEITGILAAAEIDLGRRDSRSMSLRFLNLQSAPRWPILLWL
ncbi:hypothetical protein M758_10G014100 [Ceratodon purpureus]|nr:hypothetical protein M758_10G014100 [Ceratodon purpureus]